MFLTAKEAKDHDYKKIFIQANELDSASAGLQNEAREVWLVKSKYLATNVV